MSNLEAKIHAPSDSEPDLTRLVFVVGKGGVGRSTVAAAIAQNASSQGRKVLAVDAVGDGGLGRVLGSVGGAAPEVLCLTPEVALGEYLKMFLHLPISPNRLGPTSKIFEYVAAAAPGVREVLILGKITSEVRDKSWDLVVVDTPATGHAVELLSAADTLQDVISAGPILSQTKWMSEILADEEATEAVVVTLPEELPVTESLVLLERLRAETKVRVSGVICNRMPLGLSGKGAKQAAKMSSNFAAIALARSNQSAHQCERLEQENPVFVRASHSSQDVLATVMQGLVDL